MSTDLQRGADIARYYKDLIDYPPSLVPYNTQSLHVLIERCKKGLSPEDAFIIGSLAGPLSSKGWEIVKQGCFYFPEDNGPHYNTRNYYSLHLARVYPSHPTLTEPYMGLPIAWHTVSSFQN